MVRIAQRSAFLFLVLVACLTISCGGNNTAALIPSRQAVAQPPFPGDTTVPGVAHQASASYDNPVWGKDAWQTSGTGATVLNNTLQLASSASEIAWGIWSWGPFNTGIVPQQLALDYTVPAGEEVWLLFSNYTLDKWEVYGPLDGTATSFTYDVATNYVSPTRYTYVALICAEGYSAGINKLTLTCEQDLIPPDAPENLSYRNLEATRMNLYWEASTDAVSGYWLYSGPADDFNLGDAGVSMIKEINSPAISTLLTGLTPETEYHFRLTAFDAAGNESEPTNTVNVTTPAAPYYPPPTNLQAVDVGGYWADITWENVSDPSPLGYELYTGPTADFVIGGTDVVKRNVSLILVKNFHITGLTGGTKYFCKARTLYTGWSELSEPVEFTTSESAPPVPEFTYNQNGSSTYLQTGVSIVFNPSSTTDVDTPVEELLFDWDFDNNGITDTSTTGPSNVQYTYPARGSYTCKLTVSDGTAVSVTHDLFLTFRYSYNQLGGAKASGDSPFAVATWPGDNRVAVLMITGETRYFDGTSWTTIPITGAGEVLLGDIAFSPTGLHLLAMEIESVSSDEYYVRWTKCDYDGANWVRNETDRVPGHSYKAASLAFSPNGRFSVGAVTGLGVTTSVVKSYIWHQKADNTLATNNASIGNNVWSTCAIRRSDTTSYFLYFKSPDLHLWTYTDSSNSDTVSQTISGSPEKPIMGLDPDDDSHAFWSCLNETGRIYYGDNFGSSNAAGQYYSPATAPTAALACHALSDNETELYWTSGPMDTVQYIQSYNTATDTPATLLQGIGAAADGIGTVYDDGSVSGVYLSTREQRDAQVTGFIASGSTIVNDEVVSDAYDLTDMGPVSSAFFFSDDALCGLWQQGFPTAHAAFADYAGAGLAAGKSGENAACQPLTACPTITTGEYLIAGYPYADELTVQRMMTGSSVALQEDVFTGTALPQLSSYPPDGITSLFYCANGPRDIVMREWDGSAWGSPETLYTHSADIVAMVVANTYSNSGGPGWAIAFADDNKSLQLITGDDFDHLVGPSELDTDLNTAAGVGLSLCQNGDGYAILVAYEKQGSEPGIYVAKRGGYYDDVFTFEKALVTTGTEVECINAVINVYNTTLTMSTVIYYHPEAIPDMSRVHILEDAGVNWFDVTLPVQLHGTKLGVAKNSNGDIIVTGRELLSKPYDAVMLTLYNN